MPAEKEAGADQVKRLQRCINDLVSLLALPASWSGLEPPQIVESLLDGLMRLLALDLAYAYWSAPIDSIPVEILRVARAELSFADSDGICRTIRQCVGDTPDSLADFLPQSIADQEFRLVPVRLGLHGELGLIVAGSQRPDFPSQTEKLILSVAANQAAIGLHEARLLSEQRRVAVDLDERVAERTREIQRSNIKLRKEIAERRRAEHELRRSEAKHRVVVETASDAVVSMNEAGVIILANAATKRIFGYEPEELIGRPLTLLMPESLRGLHENGYKRYVASGQKRVSWQGTEFMALRASGEEFAVEVSFGEMTADDQKIFTGFIRDISEKKLADAALAKARAELANIARITSLAELTASIAHEVNQPLSGIVTNASTCLRMLSGDPPNIDGARETARRTIRDGNRASDVITRLRTLFSRKEINFEIVDLKEAAREVVALSLSELQRNEIIVRQEFADALPPVKGDRIQLQQVILNLLRNASDAMTGVHDRPRLLSVGLAREDDQVSLRVRDTGAGFDPKVAEKLFESFYTTKHDGMGIGLSVSRSIVEAHGGRLWGAVNDGPGSTFGFSIPCAPSSGEERTVSAHSSERPEAIPKYNRRRPSNG
ncbi:MAG: PAS domain S-box protein [Acidobacteriaceae bacterium]